MASPYRFSRADASSIDKMTMKEREALVELAQKIMEAAGTEEEIDQWIDELQSRVPHPSVTDLIFHGEQHYSAQEIVDLALKYRPTPLG